MAKRTPNIRDTPTANAANHLEHKEAAEWHQGFYAKAFKPVGIDDLDAKLSIGAIAKRRAAGKASQAKESR